VVEATILRIIQPTLTGAQRVKDVKITKAVANAKSLDIAFEIVLEEICTSFDSCASQANNSKLGDKVQNTTKVAFESGTFVTTLQNETEAAKAANNGTLTDPLFSSVDTLNATGATLTTNITVLVPTYAPTSKPTTRKPVPTNLPTKIPTKIPTKKPTKIPTKKPTKIPTKKPTKRPTKRPTWKPTKKPRQGFRF
jgi:hypothetical protein